MNQVLILVQRPDKLTDIASKRWREFLDSAEAIEKKAKQTRVIASGAWLIPLQVEANIASELCSEVRRLGLQYKAFLCGEMPKDYLQAIDPFA